MQYYTNPLNYIKSVEFDEDHTWTLTVIGHPEVEYIYINSKESIPWYTFFEIDQYLNYPNNYNAEDIEYESSLLTDCPVTIKEVDPS